MEPAFWHDKWDAKQIGFHLGEVNALLIKYWPRLNLASNSQVFVPLCGKSVDICYLAEQGHDVVGCELSKTAVEDFFSENELQYSIEQQGEIQQFSTEQVTLLQGDLFSLPSEQFSHINAFYDRAALIAWPESMRLAYVEKITALIPAKSIGLLITLDYPQETLKGPPFAVSNDWVMANMSDAFEIELLSCDDVLADNQRFANKGVPWLTESVYKLTKKG
ncbi:thiopurine S-methyltransferase [Shewanella eurypsychrophilus]|uniref:Thiopurine S-methyltransferase n=1 Tax=Shewanella eurypsychrophilus TaxID=2593656 RepID=A0ABX6V3V9_9GAMM|nr:MULTISPECIES: thiopurine S-methyltransferase [Shewanella]QFU21259.1 thiopurine S-methyltransferase [Shewanella sp. YLB-09]QPG56550.1 thiopurine S-methyltransferase [Shewanella eurypsychrophilus]